MSKNYSTDHEPKLSNTIIILPHMDVIFSFSWQALQEFVEMKSLISFNLAGVRYMPKTAFTIFF